MLTFVPFIKLKQCAVTLHGVNRHWAVGNCCSKLAYQRQLCAPKYYCTSAVLFSWS